MDSDSFFLDLLFVAISPAAIVVVMILSCLIMFIVFGGIGMIGYGIVSIFSSVREYVRGRGVVAAGGGNDYELIDALDWRSAINSVENMEEQQQQKYLQQQEDDEEMAERRRRSNAPTPSSSRASSRTLSLA
ncbi:uncharacterized protein B0T23DRAFT_209132 [Neurospora hispaniola]|uniref:Uncharacterized protein n=1 Tax=Neurospora hispaniola TaxID=588809 RepID=A0AAJ0I1E0_9PEZI|nr:hypothetical protein B0T23DRAFT_209132 [Neurospora hispaniola]